MKKECSKCQAITKKGVRCKNTTCKLYPYCWTHLKSKDGLQVKKSTIANGGDGLFTTRDIKPKKVITQYSSKTVSKQPNPKSQYVLNVGKGKYIDSESKQNFPGRYINSVQGTQKTKNARFNASGRVVPKMGRQTTTVVSTKKIKAGEEILLNYGKGFKINK